MTHTVWVDLEDAEEKHGELCRYCQEDLDQRTNLRFLRRPELLNDKPSTSGSESTVRCESCGRLIGWRPKK